MTLGIDFNSKKNSPKTFAQAITVAQDSEMVARWIQVDAWNYAKDNPEYMDVFVQAWVENKTRIENVTRYASTARKFPYHRRVWKISIGFYYETASLEEWQQDILLDRVVNEGLTRDDLRAEVKIMKQEPLTETTTLELPITTINGQRYILADVIPSDVNVVKVKFEQTIHDVQEARAA